MKIWVFLKSVLPQLLHRPISPSVLLFQKRHKIQLKKKNHRGGEKQQKLLFPSLEKLPGSKSHIFVELINASPFCFLLIHNYSIPCYYIFRTEALTSALFFMWRCSPTCLTNARETQGISEQHAYFANTAAVSLEGVTQAILCV